MANIINIIEKYDPLITNSSIKNEGPKNYKEDHYFPAKQDFRAQRDKSQGILTIVFVGLLSRPSFFENSFTDRNVYHCYNKKFQQLFANKVNFDEYNKQYWSEISSLIDDKEYCVFDFIATSMGVIKLSNFLEFLHKKLDNEKDENEKNKISDFLGNVRNIHLINPAQSLESKDLRNNIFKIGASLRKTIFFDIPNFFNKILGRELKQDPANINFIKNNLLIANNESSNNLPMSKLQNIVLSQCPGDEVVEPINIQKPNNLSSKIITKKTKHHNDGFGYLDIVNNKIHIYDFLKRYDDKFSKNKNHSKSKFAKTQFNFGEKLEDDCDISNQSTDIELPDKCENQDIDEEPKLNKVTINNCKSLAKLQVEISTNNFAI